MTSDETADTNQQILRDGIAWAKREFEEERDRILNSIPESYKSMFGQIGFVKWRGKVDYPVLILNPYCVPTDPARNQWISMYKKLQKQKRLDRMTYLIYWYGASRPAVYYGFVPPSKFMPYQVEANKPDGGKAKLRSKIQEKVDQGIDLNDKEKELMQRYVEMEEDMKKDPIDRRQRGDVDFQEGYESLTLEDAIQAMKRSLRKRKKPEKSSTGKKLERNSKQHDNKRSRSRPKKKSKKSRNMSRARTSQKEYVDKDSKEEVVNTNETLIKRWRKSVVSKIVDNELWRDLANAATQFSSELILNHKLRNLFKDSVKMMKVLKLDDLESFHEFRCVFQKVHGEEGKLMSAQGNRE